MSNEGFKQGRRKQSPYELLGVSSNSSPEEIKRAYRKRAMETHPDTGGSAEAFREVSEAYEKIINSPLNRSAQHKRNPDTNPETQRHPRTGTNQQRTERPGTESSNQSTETTFKEKIDLYRKAIQAANTMDMLEQLHHSIRFDSTFGYKKPERDLQEELLAEVRKRKVDGYKQLIQVAGTKEVLEQIRHDIKFDAVFGYKQEEKKEQEKLLELVEKHSNK